MTILKQFAAYKEDQAYMDYLEEEQKKLGTLINNLCWNEDRFIRGFTEAGEVIGKRTDPEANMWLNPQSWAVISGLATKQQAELSMENVRKRLNTEYGAILMDPPYHLHAFDGALAVIYNPGTKRKCRYLFPVAGMADSGRSIAGAWGSGIYLFYGKCTVCTERSC